MKKVEIRLPTLWNQRRMRKSFAVSCLILAAALTMPTLSFAQRLPSSVTNKLAKNPSTKVPLTAGVLPAEPSQKIWIQLAKVLAQAQSVEREAWWVLTDQRLSPQRGAFIRLQRAIEKKIVDLKKPKLLACEQFDLRLEKNGAAEELTSIQGQLYEACRKPAVLLLDFSSAPPRALKLTIYPEHQADVFGLGASIFNKKVECSLSWTEKDILDKLQCTGYKRNRNEKEIVELEAFEYQRENKNLLVLRGKVTEGLVVTRKIETEVPLFGKIVVTETEVQKTAAPIFLPPPPSPPPSLLPPRQPPVALPQPPTDAPPSQPVDELGMDEAVPVAPPIEPPVALPVAPPIAPPSALPGQQPGPILSPENLAPEGVIKQSEPEMIESHDEPQAR